jgi:hypothetical protein
VIIWSITALNRSFCHFRYFWEEIWKRKHFGCFWSIKVKKTAKSENPCWELYLKTSRLHTWRRQAWKRGGSRKYTWRPRTFLVHLTWRRHQGRQGQNVYDGPELNSFLTASRLDLGYMILNLAASWRRQKLQRDAVRRYYLYIFFQFFIVSVEH